MEARRYAADTARLERSLRHAHYMNFALVFALLAALVLALSNVGRERTVVTPPTLEKSFWVSNGAASEEYIEEMATWISSLILDVTPDTIDHKARLLLRYADPRAHGVLKERQLLESARLKRDNATTYFDLETMNIHADKLAALLQGRLHTLINGTVVPEQSRNYLVRFRLDAGRAQLIQFEELDHADLAKALADVR